jgi:hypothetical protein
MARCERYANSRTPAKTRRTEATAFAGERDEAPGLTNSGNGDAKPRSAEPPGRRRGRRRRGPVEDDGDEDPVEDGESSEIVSAEIDWARACREVPSEDVLEGLDLDRDLYEAVRFTLPMPRRVV